MKDPSGIEFAFPMTPVASTLKPRKLPVQARSAVTVGALHAATIQVLVREGLKRCTTTRVAERAGTSVGSLYQYYPNRDALLRAVLEQHLDGIADAVEAACRASRGRGVAEMAEMAVHAYLGAKLRDAEESRALYSVAEERGGAEIVARGRVRMVAALAEMLSSAADARFDDPELVGTIALAAVLGPVQIVLKGLAPAGLNEKLGPELVVLMTAYLKASANAS